MKLVLNWKEGMRLEAATDGNLISMDAKPPLGKNDGMTPKELVAAGLGGCTGMDVVALLKKHKQAYENFEIGIDITMSTGKTPAVFQRAELTFNLTGPVDKNILLESVRLSQTKYCGVSEMLLKAFPIRYIVILNNEQIGEGQADFSAN
ncbi:MAG TPA: OsmC family protein [Pseudobdellovibrionaceae bacterium]|jgi:putative redox protein